MRIVGHGGCSICSRRIPSSKFKRKLGTASLWTKAKAYGDEHGISLKEEDIICQKCHICIHSGRTQNIKPLNKHAINTFQNDDIEISISQATTIASGSSSINLSQATTISSGSSFVNLSQANESSEVFIESTINDETLQMDFSESQSESSFHSTIDSQSSSINSFTFSVPKQIIKLEIPSCSGTQRKCFVCGAYDRSRIPKSAILDIWFQKTIMIPFQNRACKEHIGADNKFLPEIVEEIVHAKDTVILTANEVKEFILAITEVQNEVLSSVLDFGENCKYTSIEYEKLTGISKDNFEDLHLYCDRLHNSNNRSTKNALAMFLIKLRLNLPQAVIGILFGLKQEKVSDCIKSVRVCLEETFVPKYLGFQHISRDQAKVHQTKFANGLYKVSEDVYFIVIDATYLYIQKPSDFDLQKKTYCVHKKRNLLKPMLCVFPDGYILECEGLFYCNGENNDANILNSMLDTPTGFSSFFKKDDCVVVDRGFRDTIEKLKTMKYKALMPHLLGRTEKQFATQDANDTRFVTMLRWVVEAVNGRIKNKFRMFSSVIETSYIPVLGSLFKIGCAIINAYSPPLFTENEEHNKIVETALSRVEKENELRIFVENEQLIKKTACWKQASKSDFPDFPKLNQHHLKDVTLGVYQIHLAYLYTKKHLSKDSSYKIYINKNNDTLIRAKIESRFTKGNHQLWIKYLPNEDSEKGIVSWYCLCKVGSRVVGCCSHVASVIWFLGYARYHDKELKEGRTLTDNILDAASSMNVNGSDEEN